jgi:hypothetical protein
MAAANRTRPAGTANWEALNVLSRCALNAVVRGEVSYWVDGPGARRTAVSIDPAYARILFQ